MSDLSTELVLAVKDRRAAQHYVSEFDQARSHWQEFIDRLAEVDRIARGKFNVFGPDGKLIATEAPKTPNVVDLVLRDRAALAASVTPSLACPTPFGRDRAPAQLRERIAAGYLKANNFNEGLRTVYFRDLYKAGVNYKLVEPNYTTGIPGIRRLDPRHVLPDRAYKPGDGDKPKNIMLTAKKPLGVLCRDYPEHAEELRSVAKTAAREGQFGGHGLNDNNLVEVIEFYDASELVRVAIVPQAKGNRQGVELLRAPNLLKRLPIAVAAQPTDDGIFQGIFEQGLGALEAENTIVNLLVDSAADWASSPVISWNIKNPQDHGKGILYALDDTAFHRRTPPDQASAQIFGVMAGLRGNAREAMVFPQARAGDVQQCLAPETRILTADLRWIPVGDLKVDDEIVGFEEFNPTRPPEVKQAYGRKFQKATVTEVGRAMLPSYRVTMEDGTKFVASEGHQWLVSSTGRGARWVTTDYLYKQSQEKSDHRMPLAIKAIDTWEPQDSWAAGYLAGMYDGEGTLSKGQAASGSKVWMLAVAQRENAALARTEVALVEMGYEFGKYEPTRGGYPGSGLVQSLHMRGGRTEIARFLGQIRPPRLLEKWHTLGGADVLGQMPQKRVKFKSIEFIGEQEVVTLGTTTHTLIAEGFAHHNSIASAAFVSSILGNYSTAVAQDQALEAASWQEVLELCFATDEACLSRTNDDKPWKKPVDAKMPDGEMYTPTSAIKGQHAIDVNYGFAAGVDEMNAEIRLYSAVQNRIISPQEARAMSVFVKDEVATENAIIQNDLLQAGLAFIGQQASIGNFHPAAALNDAIRNGEDVYLVLSQLADFQQAQPAPQGTPTSAFEQAASLSRGGAGADTTNVGGVGAMPPLADLLSG